MKSTLAALWLAVASVEAKNFFLHIFNADNGDLAPSASMALSGNTLDWTAEYRV